MRFFSIIALIVAMVLAPAAHADLQSNTATAKRVFLEKMGQGRFDKLEEIYGPGFVAHSASSDYTLEEDNASGKEWRKAFPDLAVTVLRTSAEGDLVAVHWRAVGTNSVAAAGTPGKGKKADVQGMTFFRFTEGRIVEEWSLIDMATANKQLQ